MSEIIEITKESDVQDLNDYLLNEVGVKAISSISEEQNELIIKVKTQTSDETFVILPKLKEPLLKFKKLAQPKYDKLIFGKDETERIVSVEPINNQLLIFRETQDGQILTTTIPNKYWVLAKDPIDTYFRMLEGEQHYQWIKYYEDFEEYNQERKRLYKYDTYSIYDPKESAMVKHGITYFKGMKLSDLSILSFDIETTGLKHSKDAQVLLISNTFRKNGKIERKLFAYDDFENQKEMLEAWCSWIRKKDPSILIGHNIYVFDLPYLQYVAEENNCELNLGRDGSPIHFNTFDSRFRKDGSQFYTYKRAHVFGRELIDTFFLSIKYDIGRKYDSYGLKQIVSQEGLEKKDRVFYDASKIRENYKNPVEWKKIKDYCRDDSDDSISLFDLMAPSFFYLTQMVPKPFQEIINSASGSQLNSMMIRSYLQDGFAIAKASEIRKIPGGMSFGKPGIYKNIVRFDISSLYPSIIREFKLYNSIKDPQAHFYKIADTLTLRRLEYKEMHKQTKDKYYKDLQESFKIIINSLYGFLNAKLNYNDPCIAQFITEKGRELLKKAIAWAGGSKAGEEAIELCKSEHQDEEEE